MLIDKSDKDNSNIQTLIGFTYRNLGDYDNSISYYKKAIKIIELMAQEFKILGEYKDQKL